MRMKALCGLGAVEEAREPWSDLLERTPGATPFQSPEWVLPWWRHLGGGELRVVLLHEGSANGGLAGIAPLFLYNFEGRRQISLAGIGVSDYLEPLFAPGAEEEGARRLLGFLEETRQDWELCDLPDLADSSPLLRVQAPPGLEPDREPLEGTVVLPLPADVPSFRNALSAHHRRNLRRAWSLLSRRGEPRFLSPGPEDDAGNRNVLEELIRLHRRRWELRGEPGVLDDARVQAFHREVADGFRRRGWLRLHALRCAGQVRAALYAFARGGRTYAYLGGFDPAMEQASPGTLLTAYAIERAIAEGGAAYDLLRGREPHKYLWGGRDRPSARLRLRPR